MITNSGKTLRFRRTLNIPVEKLYEAWTKPEIVKAWWKDLSVAEMDFRLGGKYRLTWKPDNDDQVEGKYKEIIPNQKIVMTWDTACRGRPPTGDTIVTLLFESRGPTSSVLELRHELLPNELEIDSHSLGWTCALLDLDRFYNGETRKIDPSLRVEVTRNLAFPVEKVWDAWTKPEMLNRWFNSSGHTLGKAEVQLQVGRNFFVDYQFPKAKPNAGDILRVYCEYKEIIPMEKLVFLWANEDHEEEAHLDKCTESRVTVTFVPKGSGTELKVVHDQLVSDVSAKDYEAGWTDCLRSIEEELTKG